MRTRWILQIIAALLALLTLKIVIETLFGGSSDIPCEINQETQPPSPFNQGAFPPAVIVASAAVAASLGRLIGFRSAGRQVKSTLTTHAITPASATAAQEVETALDEPPVRGEPDRVLEQQEKVAIGKASIPAVISALRVQIVLCAFLVLALFALVYETLAVALDNNPWTISFMVRCVNNAHPLGTLLTAIAVLFVLGNWLWFPHLRRMPDGN
jgi:hypothetical protein